MKGPRAPRLCNTPRVHKYTQKHRARNRAPYSPDYEYSTLRRGRVPTARTHFVYVLCGVWAAGVGAVLCTVLWCASVLIYLYRRLLF